MTSLECHPYGPYAAISRQIGYIFLFAVIQQPLERYSLPPSQLAFYLLDDAIFNYLSYAEEILNEKYFSYKWIAQK